MPRLTPFAALLVGFMLVAPVRTDDKHDEVVKVKAPEVADTGPRPDLDKVAAAIVEQANLFRKSQERKPIAVEAKLDKTSQEFAAFMAKTDEYGHRAGGTTPAERAKKQDYDYCIVLENIGYAFHSDGFTAEKLADLFATGWEKSPGHRKNLMDPDVTEIGVALARSDTTGHYYAVQMFGRPKSAAVEFSIKNSAGEAVDYSVGGQAFRLEPRYTRTHTICRPEEVKFMWPGDKSDTVKPAAGDKFAVTKDGEAYKVAKE